MSSTESTLKKRTWKEKIQPYLGALVVFLIGVVFFVGAGICGYLAFKDSSRLELTYVVPLILGGIIGISMMALARELFPQQRKSV